VKLNDGRQEDHFGDGASVGLVRDADDNGKRDMPYSGSDDRNFLRIEAMLYGEGAHPFDEFLVQGGGQSEQESVWLVPIEQISEIGFGYCT
jgi:hypothetical protein